jgi:hypothetical protein
MSHAVLMNWQTIIYLTHRWKANVLRAIAT